MPKPLVIIMGACAAGKSTLGRYLLGKAEEYRTTFVVSALNRAQVPQPPAPEEVRYCINPKTGFAVAGNLQGGSDCINSRAALVKLTEFLVKDKRTKLVIVNSVRFSQQADIYDVAHWKAVRPIYICFNLSPAENFKRLLQRRKGLPLSQLQADNLTRFRHRNDLNLAKVREVYAKPELIVAGDKDSCKRIEEALCLMM